jgi:malonate-semialdehyde dehydrogenase (acetylating) / methylmalonate-semialdehyde dehydrogenase
MKFLDLVTRDIEPLAELLAGENGKTITDAKGDVQQRSSEQPSAFRRGTPADLRGHLGR